MTEEKKLRSGFTTGTCAAAAAKAAARMLISGKEETGTAILTPAGKPAEFSVKEILIKRGADDSPVSVRCAVVKDAGDDPDVTNGALVFACVSHIRDVPKDRPVYDCYEGEAAIYITGGTGVGLVTKAGLACPTGFHAINPAPRRMIASAVSEGLPPGWAGKLLVEISIPAGIGLASKTFNPKLGVEGGISILGTTGIVNPMSEQALIETIRLEIRVRAAEGRTILALAPGNYGEAFVKERLGISMNAFVKCSNFVGDAVSMMKEEGIKSILFAGHLGKLIKVAGGVLNTHSRFGDRRMEILSDCALSAGVSESLAAKLLEGNTTEEAALLLRDWGVLDEVMEIAASRVKKTLEDESGLHAEAVLFTEQCGILAMTEGAALMAERLRGLEKTRETDK